MVYAVELTLRAERDLNELYGYLAAANSEAARQWFNGLERAIYTLSGSQAAARGLQRHANLAGH